MERSITSFHLNRFREWVADLDCGHEIRMLHNPPYLSCSWVATAKGRQSHIGDIQECVNCEMPELPEGVKLQEKSPLYQRDTIPIHMSSGYKMEAGVWARVVVKKGLLQFLIHSEPPQGFVLDEHLEGVLTPEVGHDIKPAMGAVEFYVEYYHE